MRFAYDFDEATENAISYETEEGQRAVVECDDSVAVLYVNRAGCLFLAKLFAQLAHCHLQQGFHVHLGVNLDVEAPEVLRVVLE
jgi:hypothetical protein